MDRSAVLDVSGNPFPEMAHPAVFVGELFLRKNRRRDSLRLRRSRHPLEVWLAETWRDGFRANEGYGSFSMPANLRI